MFPNPTQQQRSVEEQLALVPPAPREPSKRARRLVFAFAGGEKVLLIVGGVFSAVGLVITLAFCWSLPADIALDLAGVQVMGRVTGSELDYSVRVNGRHPMRMGFAFDVDGARIEGEASTFIREIATLEPGAPIPLEVLPSRPQWARVAGDTSSMLGYWGLLLALFPALGGALLFFAIRSNRRQIHGFRWGTPVLARVVRAGLNRSVRVNGRHPFQIGWEFTAADGEVFEGSLSSMKVTELEPYARAGRVVVLHDPQHPEVNTLWVE